MLKNLKQFNLPEIEEKVLRFWRDNKIFEKSVALRQAQGEKAKFFRFFEGPPTANGRPGIHHVESRSFKDIILRYKTMRGYYVLRRAGWDTHGLPVEIEVEKELGIKNKQEIEKFGIAEFNAKAKASVWKYKSEWERLTERIGFWLDLENPYITYENKYIESLWWVLAQIAKKGFLKNLYKVVPWCPRCQTSLSSHELGQPGAYQKTKDPSLYVKFKLKPSFAKASEGKQAKNTFLLVWTTTPWTLPANVAVAINQKLTYTKYKVGEEFLWSANPVPKLEGKEIEVVEKISGRKLVGLEYEPLYKVSSFKIQDSSYRVIAGDFVSTEEGTGLVHIAPAFGEDDLRVFEENREKRIEDRDDVFPVTIDDRGIVNKGLPGAGKFIKEADKNIVADLNKRGLVYKIDAIEHDYPFCWRCSTPLIYFARSSWFIEMSRLREKLLSANKTINWIPQHIKEGRFGEWLRDIKDWNVSRARYWGTPLPIWSHSSKLENSCLPDRQAKSKVQSSKNECGEHLVIGSLEDLNKYAYNKNNFFLIRHTESDHNVKNIFAFGPERNNNVSRLTKKGIEQAKHIASELKKAKVSVIFTSSYKRTRQVADIIAKTTGAKVFIDRRLGELDPGVFSGRPVAEYHRFFKDPLERFYKAPPGGENLTNAKKRMMTAIKDINRRFQNKNIAIVSHGDPLWALEAAIKCVPPDQMDKVPYIDVGEYHNISFDNWPYNSDGELDLHRPFVDEIYLNCDKCGGTLSRVKEVADVWFDSGAMPFAQWHYPFENQALINRGKQYPADYITEGIDQTRGWFYTLLAVAVALGEKAPYHNVVSLGLVLDKNGQKMSKSKGNVVDPWQMVQKYGADVVRWYFYTINPPGEPKKFDEADLRKMFNKLFLILYNSYVFYANYGNDKATPIKALDNWVLARLNEAFKNAGSYLEQYDIGAAARTLESFVDDLSRWYIRRSRRNFSPKVVNYVLLELSKALAPFAPFFSEALYQSLRGTRGLNADQRGNSQRGSVSVHLENWPSAVQKAADQALLKKMQEARTLCGLALAEREKLVIRVRQPLSELKIKSKTIKKTDKDVLRLIADEVNVKKVIIDTKIKTAVVLDATITPELRNEGLLRELTRLVQGLRHDAGYTPAHSTILYLEAPRELTDIVEANAAQFKKDVKAKTIIFKKAQKFDAELNTKIKDWEVWIGVKKPA